jgi:hypothetical protein
VRVRAFLLGYEPLVFYSFDKKEREHRAGRFPWVL